MESGILWYLVVEDLKTMRNSRPFKNTFIALFLISTLLLSNGCAINDVIDLSKPIFEFSERSLFESLRGIY